MTATSLIVGAGPASAAHITCGQTIVASTKLDGNVGPCAEGLTIGPNNVVLDRNGFTISGQPTAGEGPGKARVGRACGGGRDHPSRASARSR